MPRIKFLCTYGIDCGFMYFPREELVPFLQDVNVAVKSVCDESGFKKYGPSLIQETTKFIY